ncbi:hypothetical protein L486_02479 [Kwoniella mangroviensis CBS 10435]|uniref:SET domain-containing protein n=1 Tax=Kwoniella mangroviensis CBS 10435 TaxID=1331196 RepID=A0A1B9IWA9_9TREE|nr:uncharacterized protein I203_01680 [Kwoniella mangroviensis CBS 8507]OCF59806.1 hypothetical protein L486_02479 [Kwoniella mangroviensis CBS 10435]OCF69816.1 hypothetical protein I203_01680 [Kwoniella mangroviensis CBS 8507]OCF71331.1 hypothetical protein I204_07958 [Kwoniella mangroviensis CBS 8886]
MTTFEPTEFLEWFQKAGGWYNDKYLGLKPFKGMGYGAVALDRIPEDAPLFHIPDSLILSPFTSELSTKLSEEEWPRLDHGWCKLILVMMWESERGKESPWSGYLSNMPREFDTPMLWDDEERKELVGTDIEDRIGKEEAEKEYTEHLLPVIKAHPELFPPSSTHHTLDSFHLQGSRILSRSFTVRSSRFNPKDKESDGQSDFSDDDDDEDQIAVMIPFADMLNAAFERDNAHLFADEEINDEDEDEHERGKEKGKGFTMKSTKVIEKDEQIYNTYASPPNSELLRKYGHVDILPLPSDLLALLTEEEIGGWGYGNPADEVLIDGEMVLKCVEKVTNKQQGEDLDKWKGKMTKRIDWWLEEGQEDMFPLSLSPEIDESLIAFIRLLIHDQEWLRAKKKGKLPTTTIDNDVAVIIREAIQSRLSRYIGDIRSDLSIIHSLDIDHIPRPNASTTQADGIKAEAKGEQVNAKNLRKCYAAIVRLGEKRILKVALRIVEAQLNKKRKAEDQ